MYACDFGDLTSVCVCLVYPHVWDSLQSYRSFASSYFSRFLSDCEDVAVM